MATVLCAALLCGIPHLQALVLTLAAAAAFGDARSHRIPNTLSIITAATAVCAWVAAGASINALIVAAIVAAGLYALFDAGLMGGGDVKLLPSLTLAAASAGGAEAPRAVIFLCVLFTVASIWGMLSRQREIPLAVGGPLALAVAVTI